MAKPKATSKAQTASLHPAAHKYTLKFLPSALKEWRELNGSVKENLRKVLRARLDNPHVPGSSLHGELKGYYKIKLRKQGYRLVYGVEDNVLVVMVVAVEKREDSEAYASAVSRLLQLKKVPAEEAGAPQPLRHAKRRR